MRLVLAVVACSGPAAAGPEGDLVKRWEQTARVSIKDKSIRVADAIEKICRKTGQDQLRISAKAGQRIALELENATFFEAVDAVAERAGLALKTPGRWSDAGHFSLVARPEGMKRIPPVHSGPARLALFGIYAERNAARRFEPDASEPDTTPRKLWLELHCLFEKGLDGVVLGSVELDTVTDDADQSLVDKRTVAAGDDGEARVDLKAGGPGSLMIRELRGRAIVLIPRKVAELKLTPRARNRAKTLGKAKFTMVQCLRKGSKNQPELVVALKGVPCPELGGKSDWGRVDVVTASLWRSRRAEVAIYLYTGSGKEIGTAGSRTDSGLGDAPVVYTFQLDDYPARIVVRSITEVVRREIPFHFSDLPIPR